MIVLTLGKNVFPENVTDHDKYLRDFRAKFKAEYGYPVMFVNDSKIDGLKISFRFNNGSKGVPFLKVDEVLNCIKSSFNVQ